MKASEDGGRDRNGPRRDVAVMGGGLAGLTAAAFLARAGLDVMVFEMKSEVGGRARTGREKGFAFNEGAHALYRSGAMARTARDLGMELSGGSGPTWATWAVQGERLFRLPVSAPGLMLTDGLDWREKLEFGRLLAGLGRLEPADHAVVPVGRWIDRRLDSATNRALLRALVRLTTYCPEDDLDAAAALSALQKGNRGVLYLDGGWQTLVDGLRSRAREAGARIETDTRIAAVEWDRTPLAVRTKTGDRMEADQAVLAVRPREAARLAHPTPPSLEEAARSATPVRVAALDLGLERRPIAKRALALDVDTPLYLSDHAESADLAPGNGALVHAVRYLGGRTPHPEEDRARIESFLDRVQPGWRKRVETCRFLPGAVVAHDAPFARTGGLDGRYGPSVEESDRLLVAGDWVGSVGMLSDAAAASARRAAARICERTSQGRSEDADLDRAV